MVLQQAETKLAQLAVAQVTPRPLNVAPVPVQPLTDVRVQVPELKQHAPTVAVQGLVGRQGLLSPW